MRNAIVVGTGFGCVAHVRSLRAAGFEIAALVGRDPTKTAQRAAQFGVENPMISLKEALTMPSVEVVAVATPPHTHAEIVLEAIEAGKHVLCEKPFARDRQEAALMQRAAEDAGVINLLGTELRWTTTQALSTRAILDGAIGDCRLAIYLLHAPLLAAADTKVPTWWADADQGGGWLGALASHVVDQVRITLGEFAGVSAALPHVSSHDWTAEDSYSIRFRLTSGVEGIMQGCAVDFGPPLVMSRVVGTSGTLWVDGDEVWVADTDGTRKLHVPDDLVTAPTNPPPSASIQTSYDHMVSSGNEMGPYTRLYTVLRDLIDGNPTPSDPRPATFADGVAGMAVLDAIRESARSGKWVAL